ncbi:MAG: DNA-protecting protein DprA, partial [Fimbriimonas ginsengisoli]|nr:DNA-protecting protein DprA [Fimbriimonas ginsengisoli]
ASKFAEALARAGATVISGGALGIDSAAHRGALAVGGRTAAVLAGGVDRVYPAVHAGLFMQIREHGCLVSQFALGSSPSGYRFLVRNRLIAGLCRAVVVVEAPERSGALSTAHAANDFGREVFVVPATIDKMGFRGSHALIRDGATLVDHPDQVLEAVGLPTSAALAAPERSPASSVGEAILAALTENPITTDRLAEQTGLGAAQLLAELTDLEMEGWVTKHPGGFAKRV